MTNQDPARRSSLAAVRDSSSQLREAQRALEDAEQRCGRIESLVSLAEKAREDDDNDRERAHEQEAQEIRESLGAAKWNLQDARRALLGCLRIAAVQTDVARLTLDQIEKLSPYPSVRVAGEILELIDALPTDDRPSVDDRSIPSWSKLHSLPDRRPSPADRQRLAELIRETIDAGRYTLEFAWKEMGVAEATLKRLRNAERVHPETWRKAIAFVRKHHPDAMR